MGVLTDSLWPDLCFLLFAFWTVAYIYASRNFNFWLKLGIPYIKPIPFLGNFSNPMLLRLSVAQLLKKVYEEHQDKPFVGMFAFDQPFLLMRNRYLAKHLLSNDITSNTARSLLGPNNIFGSNDERWKITRGKISPTFIASQMEQMFYILNEIGMDFTSSLEMIATTEFGNDKTIAQDFLCILEDFNASFHVVNFTLYHLALHHELQSCLREEIHQHQDSFTYESISNMKLLDMIVKETLRMYPLFAFVERKTLSDCKLPGTDTIIPANTSVAISIWGHHMDPAFHPNSDSYIPERFSEKNKVYIEGYTYMPFGDTLYNEKGITLGLMHSKVILAHILSKYLVENYEDSAEILDFNSSSFLKNSANGIPLIFRKIC